MTDATQDDMVNPKTGMTHDEMKQFIRRHFDDFVNKQRLDVADENFAEGFVDHGDDVPPGLPPARPVPSDISKAPSDAFPTSRSRSRT